MTSLTMKGALQRWAGRLATAATLGLVAAGPGQAAVYVGTWDPVFDLADPLFGTSGSAFANLGWRGAISFTVDGCTPTVLTGFFEINVGATPGCTATMTSARVEFYNAALGLSAPTVASIDYTLAQLGDISFLRYDDGELTGLGYFGTQNVAASPGAALGSPTVYWSLSFGYPSLGAFEFPYNGAHLSYCTNIVNYGTPSNPSFGCDEVGEVGRNSVETPITIRRVPVPGTLALALAGLAVMLPLRARSRAER